MKIQHRSLLASLLVVALATGITVFTGCTGGKKPVDEALQTQVFYWGNGTNPSSLDPQIATGVPEHHILLALFEGLVNPDPKDLSPEPGVAESWKISKDLKTYTFKIRKNAKWSNGDPLTAHDFVYSWKRALSPALAAEFSNLLYPLENAEAFNKGKIKDFSKVGVKATNDHELVVKLHSPTPYFLEILQHYYTHPVHKATIEKFGKMDQRGTKWTRPENIVSNGAFNLDKSEINKPVVVVRNQHYWDKEIVRLKAIHYFPTESQQTEERMFRAGRLHLTNEVPLEKVATYQEKNSPFLHVESYLGTYFYLFNTTKKPFNDPRVREAFNLSVDREAIVKRVTKGGQLPAFSLVPPNTSGYTSEHRTEYNLEKAKKLLAAAGYPGGKGFPKAEILYNTSEAHKKVAVAVQQMWKRDLGVEVQLVNQDWKVYLDTQNKLNFDLSRRGWIGDYADPNAFLELFTSYSGNNNTGWKNPKFDSLIERASREGNRKKRMALLQSAEKLLMTELPIIPFYTYMSVYLLSTDVKGWHANILDTHPPKYIYLDRGAGQGQAKAAKAE